MKPFNLIPTEVTYFGKGKTARATSSKLVCYVTETLTLTFSHDTEGFLTRDRFDTVMQPLVDQVCACPAFLCRLSFLSVFHPASLLICLTLSYILFEYLFDIFLVYYNIFNLKKYLRFLDKIPFFKKIFT